MTPVLITFHSCEHLSASRTALSYHQMHMESGLLGLGSSSMRWEFRPSVSHLPSFYVWRVEKIKLSKSQDHIILCGGPDVPEKLTPVIVLAEAGIRVAAISLVQGHARDGAAVVHPDPRLDRQSTSRIGL